MVQKVGVAALIHGPMGVHKADVALEVYAVLKGHAQIVDQLLLFLCEL